MSEETNHLQEKPADNPNPNRQFVSEMATEIHIIKPILNCGSYYNL
jgi:hypothetical protein